MGGDRAPEEVVRGVNIAAERHPAARFLLVGDEERLKNAKSLRMTDER